MKIKTKQILAPFIFCAILLTGCGAVTPISVPIPTRTLTPPLPETDTPGIPTNDQAGRIEPENVGSLGISDRWGQGNVYGVALSPDENTIAVATANGVTLYDYKSLNQKQFIDLPIVLSSKWTYSPSKAIAFSPDGNLLAVGYDDITIWNLAKNIDETRIENRITGFNVVQLAFNPRGNTIVVMSMGGYGPCDAWGGNFALYDIKSKALLYNDYFCPESSLFHFTFLNNGNVAFAGITREVSPWTYKVSIVDSTTGTLARKMNFDGSVDSISPDGTKIAVGSDQTGATEIIDTTSRQILGHADGISLFLPNTQNHQLIANDKDWRITAGDGKVICKFENTPNLTLGIYRSAYNFTGNDLVFWDGGKQNVEIWDTFDCKLLKQLFIPAGNNSITYSPDGKFLAVSDWYYIHLLDGKTGEYHFSIPGSYNMTPSQYYDFSADGQKIATVNRDKPYTISIWDAAAGKEIKTIPTNFNDGEYISLSPNGTALVTVDSEGTHLWDLENGALAKTIPDSFGGIHFNPNGDKFAQMGEHNIIFRNTKTGEIENQIPVSFNNLSISFSKNWTYIAIYGDRQLVLWNMNGMKIRDFVNYPADTSNPGDSVFYDLAFSPDDHMLAAIRYDYNNYNILFWDTNTGMILRDIAVPFRISMLAFSPDGENLAVLGDGIITIWGIQKP